MIRSTILPALLTLATVGMGITVALALASMGCRGWLAGFAGVSVSLTFLVVPVMVKVMVESE